MGFEPTVPLLVHLISSLIPTWQDCRCFWLFPVVLYTGKRWKTRAFSCRRARIPCCTAIFAKMPILRRFWHVCKKLARKRQDGNPLYTQGLSDVGYPVGKKMARNRKGNFGFDLTERSQICRRNLGLCRFRKLRAPLSQKTRFASSAR